jgi:hypothetical protein
MSLNIKLIYIDIYIYECMCEIQSKEMRRDGWFNRMGRG